MDVALDVQTRQRQIGEHARLVRGLVQRLPGNPGRFPVERHAVGRLPGAGLPPPIEANEVAHRARFVARTLVVPSERIEAVRLELKADDRAAEHVDHKASALALEHDGAATVDDRLAGERRRDEQSKDYRPNE